MERLPGFGPDPRVVVCPSCNSQVKTKVKAEAYAKTHLTAALLCLVACCFLPYCIKSCKKRNHYCPKCDAYLGTYV